jgi:hypothetical protein
MDFLYEIKMGKQKGSMKNTKKHAKKSLFVYSKNIFFFGFTQLLMMNWRDLSFVVLVSEMDDFHYYFLRIRDQKSIFQGEWVG